MKIMVGYDRSNVAKDALELADQHANVFDAKVYVLTSLAQSRELQLEDIQKAERIGPHFETKDLPILRRSKSDFMSPHHHPFRISLIISLSTSITYLIPLTLEASSVRAAISLRVI